MVGAQAVPQTEAHRLIEHLMILTNEQVAELLERRRVPTLYRVHEQPDPERIERMIEQLAALDDPDAAAAQDPLASSRPARSPARRAAWWPARPRGAGTAARRIHRWCFARSSRPTTADEPRPRRPRQPRLRPLHLADPPLPRPCRAPRALAPAGAEEAPRPRSWRRSARHCSERERDATRIERADSVCASFLLERELFERGPETRFEGEVSGVVGAGAFVRFGGAMADVYEGFLPARRIGGRERYELDATETMLVGARGGSRDPHGRPVTVSVDRVEAPRGRVDLLPARGEGQDRGSVEEVEAAAGRTARAAATSPPTAAPGTSSRCSRGWRPGSSCGAAR